MTLKVYDTQRAKKSEFAPVNQGEIGMYFCGMTVQDKPHMGHMLAFVAGDMIRRYLEFKGYTVKYIQNFTDIDDKIIDKANTEGIGYNEVAERNIAAYFRAAEALHIKPATRYPKATEHIKEILDLIGKLVENGHAYESGGDVYFRVRTFAGYGKLSKRKLDDLMSGARIAVGEQKEDPLDFALWKASKPNEPGWDSPWGRGRPGWHIECSAMSMKYLGDTLDFHGGGEDLIFPHHENEIAQSEAATGRPFVHFWLHNGLLNLRGEKMSKSTGHFFAMEDVLREFSGDVCRFYFLSAHFRKQTEFSRERLEEAGRSYERLRLACLSLDENIRKLEDTPGISSPAGTALKEAAEKSKSDFFEAMDDDFNSAAALGCVFDLVKTYYRLVEEGGAVVTQDRGALEAVRDAMVAFDRILGVFPDGLPTHAAEVPEEANRLLAERQSARKAKDFKKADEIRARLDEMGFVVEDTPDGVRIRRK